MESFDENKIFYWKSVKVSKKGKFLNQTFIKDIYGRLLAEKN